MFNANMWIQEPSRRPHPELVEMTESNQRRYTATHEWFQITDDGVTVGLTAYAVNELTDITYVEMRDQGTAITAGDVVGEVESVKTTSDIYSGEIAQVNEALNEDPSLINSDPYGQGWLIRIKSDNISSLDELMSEAEYAEKYPVE
jgi:glycine cleavage system H protein